MGICFCVGVLLIRIEDLPGWSRIRWTGGGANRGSAQAMGIFGLQEGVRGSGNGFIVVSEGTGSSGNCFVSVISGVRVIVMSKHRMEFFTTKTQRQTPNPACVRSEFLVILRCPE